MVGSIETISGEWERGALWTSSPLSLIVAVALSEYDASSVRIWYTVSMALAMGAFHGHPDLPLASEVGEILVWRGKLLGFAHACRLRENSQASHRLRKSLRGYRHVAETTLSLKQCE